MSYQLANKAASGKVFCKIYPKYCRSCGVYWAISGLYQQRDSVKVKASVKNSDTQCRTASTAACSAAENTRCTLDWDSVPLHQVKSWNNFHKSAQFSQICKQELTLCQFLRLTYSRSIVLVPEQDFRSRVGQRAARGVEFFPGLKAVAEAKVGELDDALLLEEHHVLRLQVPVHHVQPVTVGDGVDNLGKVTLGHLEEERQKAKYIWV